MTEEENNQEEEQAMSQEEKDELMGSTAGCRLAVKKEVKD